MFLLQTEIAFVHTSKRVLIICSWICLSCFLNSAHWFSDRVTVVQFTGDKDKKFWPVPNKVIIGLQKIRNKLLLTHIDINHMWHIKWHIDIFIYTFIVLLSLSKLKIINEFSFIVIKCKSVTCSAEEQKFGFGMVHHYEVIYSCKLLIVYFLLNRG